MGRTTDHLGYIPQNFLYIHLPELLGAFTDPLSLKKNVVD